MEKRGIGVGSSPIGDEGFAHPSARLRRSKTKIGFYTYILYIYNCNNIVGYSYVGDFALLV